MEEIPQINCDVLVIGSGLTGMAASLFAVTRGLDTAQVGTSGELGFASGLIDLLGIHPVADGQERDDPWRAVDGLSNSHPRHPYARLNKKEMHSALTAFQSFLADNGLPYHIDNGRNQRLILPTGTIKPTYAVPITVRNNARALAEKSPCLIVDFHGLKGFSGRQMVEMLRPVWPALTTRRITFPDGGGELLCEHMALSLEQADTRARLAETIIPHLDSVDYVGLPAILGIYRPMLVFDDLRQRLQRPLFEIPTMPPAIGGLRLKNIFEQALPRMGVKTLYQQKVLTVAPGSPAGFHLHIGQKGTPRQIVTARAVILATGRFIGGGLAADRRQIRETVFNLPLYQPAARTDWHRKSFFDPNGHPINRFGLETNETLQPVDAAGQVIHPGLFAAGSILAHQDWMRQKCGAGLGITTAHAAVSACFRFIDA